ncbi:hypothetical protein PybrP1_004370 [[Pythium] brassicae (nom. inval.)]|nr:hypothetical protein PybrP1_004370 [[Pythium] brassicae (nom. inval.)]
MMTKSYFSYSGLFALALAASAATAQDTTAFESVALDGNVLGAVTLPSDASLTQERTTEEDRSADALARSANEAAAPEQENRADDVTLLGGATVLGGWLGLALDKYAVSVLVNALGQPSNYDPSIASPVCVLQINSGTFQTVSGTNFRYKILGCPVSFADELGACRKRDCAAANFEVAVFEQTWTNTLQVLSITPKQ